MEMDLGDMVLMLFLNMTALPIGYAIISRVHKRIDKQAILQKLHLTTTKSS